MDDLAHDVFVTAARRLSSFDATRPTRPWLFGIAFRVFSELRRRERPQEEVPEDLQDPSPGPEDSVARQQARKILQRALATLPEERRVAFVLHELEGLSVNETSEVMEAPAPTTYSRLKLARDEVAAAVRRFALVATAKVGAP